MKISIILFLVLGTVSANAKIYTSPSLEVANLLTMSIAGSHYTTGKDFQVTLQGANGCSLKVETIFGDSYWGIQDRRDLSNFTISIEDGQGRSVGFRRLSEVYDYSYSKAGSVRTLKFQNRKNCRMGILPGAMSCSNEYGQIQVERNNMYKIKRVSISKADSILPFSGDSIACEINN